MPTNTAIPPIPFRNPRLSRVGVEVLSLRELRARAPSTLKGPQRLEFFLLCLVTEGAGSHRVDFQEHDIESGAMIFVRRGQVQQWRLNDSLQGLVLLIKPEALSPAISRADADLPLMALDRWRPVTRLDPKLFEQTRDEIGRLRTDIEGFAGSEIDTALIWHALYALLLRLARESGDVGAATSEAAPTRVHLRFARELETNFSRRLSVRDFAERVGCSESSLSRACLEITGRTAKQLIDERVTLEAKRWLVHGKQGVKEISAELGFSEPTNFNRFFRRIEGTTPTAFRRAAMRG